MVLKLNKHIRCSLWLKSQADVSLTTLGQEASPHPVVLGPAAFVFFFCVNHLDVLEVVHAQSLVLFTHLTEKRKQFVGFQRDLPINE